MPQLVAVPTLQTRMEAAANRLLVFDNCRNNPADGWRQQATVNAARINATEKATALLSESSTFVLHSTVSGRIALDGPPGENSPFASALLRQLEGPSIDLQALPAKLRRDLPVATEGRQLVWDYNTYVAPLVLNRGGKPPRSAMPVRELSRVVELPNAFSSAQAAKLVLPQGLIAYRARHGSPYAWKIGAFKYSAKAWVTQNATSIEPVLVAVMAVVDDSAAELIYASREFGPRGAGAFWQFASSELSGDRLVWRNAERTSKFELAWKDSNSGEMFGTHGGRSLGGGVGSDYNRFARLDG